jgi:hypothetical protein
MTHRQVLQAVAAKIIKNSTTVSAFVECWSLRVDMARYSVEQLGFLYDMKCGF